MCDLCGEEFPGIRQLKVFKIQTWSVWWRDEFIRIFTLAIDSFFYVR